MKQGKKTNWKALAARQDYAQLPTLSEIRTENYVGVRQWSQAHRGLKNISKLKILTKNVKTAKKKAGLHLASIKFK